MRTNPDKRDYFLMCAMDLLVELSDEETQKNPYKMMTSKVRAKMLARDIEEWFTEEKL